MAGRTPAIFSQVLCWALPPPPLGWGLLQACSLPSPSSLYTSVPAALRCSALRSSLDGGGWVQTGVADLGPLPRALGAAC